MEKMDLIKIAVSEWLEGDLSAEEAMNNISVVLGVCDPSEDGLEWARQAAIMDEFFEAVDEVGFKFWICPNGCQDFVDWDGDKATCRKCGADNQAPDSEPQKDAARSA